MPAAEYYITPAEYTKALANGVDRKRLNDRIRHQGWSHDRAINTPSRGWGVKVGSGNLKSWEVLAAKNNISFRTFRNRVYKLRWAPEKAATTPIDLLHKPIVRVVI